MLFFYIYTILIKIADLNNKLINQIKSIYFNYYYEKLYEDWEDTIPNTVADILNKLQNMSQNSEMELIIQFAACLLKSLLSQETIPQPKLEQLNNWVRDNANNYSVLLTKIKNGNESTNESAIIPTHLIILLNPSQQNHERYIVSAWFIYDGGNDEFNYQTAKGYKPLEIQHQDKETFSLLEISRLLDDYLEQIIPYMNDNSAQPTIEIFLPYKLLNQPIDTWRVQNDGFPVSVGSLYQVIVRSSNRLNKYRFRNVWVQKWNNLKKLTEHNCSQCFISGDFSSGEELFSTLNQDEIIALILINPAPTEEYFKAINTIALPVALWFREKLNIQNFEDEINLLLECLITELPKRVKQKRSSDFSCNHDEQPIGHHLSLLWENPYIIPPSPINYITP